MSHAQPKNGVVRFLLEFSIPLIAGVVVALIWANVAPENYKHLWGGHNDHPWELIPGFSILGHHLTLKFFVNDVFMVFFFGIAAKEITEACLPGGSLNPPSKAVSPLIATIGGVAGPVGVFFLGLYLLHGAGAFPETYSFEALARGWGIPTATDIALAWLVARAVFGKGHPAINFLLLLAVADDAIGLVIIAIFYGDPAHPAQWSMLLITLLGMAVAFGLRRAGVKDWRLYIFVAGPLAWCGLVMAHLHAALALVFIVPFLPGPKRDTGLFVHEDEVDVAKAAGDGHGDEEHAPLEQFEDSLKTFVDIGLFFFAVGNAGVGFGEIGPMTWLILASLVVGKTIGIFGLAALVTKLGIPLPDRMGMKELVMAGFIAALGLTVALFVAGAAFTDPSLQAQAKMGALFSGGVGFAAIALGKALGVGRPSE